MGPVRRAWLICSCLAPLALCLRGVNLPTQPTPSPGVYKNATQQCAGDDAQEIVLEREVFGAEETDDPLRLWPEIPSLLNGTQWCDASRAPPSLLKKRVALVMVGQAFRSRNYYSDVRASCTDGTEPVQERLVSNHLETVVEPIEQTLGMQVDIFLTDSPCGQERNVQIHALKEVAKPSFDRIGKLKLWYGPERVKGVVRTQITDNMHGRVAEVFRHVDEHMLDQEGTYEYFIVLRYDVFLDRPFLTTLRKGGDEAHGGLSYVVAAHDWLFAFPGETWGCVLRMWTECLAKVEAIGTINKKRLSRREAGCFDFGPLHIREWGSGFGYAMMLKELTKEIFRRRGELLPDRKNWFRQTGVSAFGAQGKEYRCTGGWYWPPKHSFEDRSMPCYFHVG